MGDPGPGADLRGCPGFACGLGPGPVRASSLYPQKPKLKPGKSLPVGVEELGQLPPSEGPGGRPLRKSFRRGEAGGSLGKEWGREFRQALRTPPSSYLSQSVRL